MFPRCAAFPASPQTGVPAQIRGFGAPDNYRPNTEVPAPAAKQHRDSRHRKGIAPMTIFINPGSGPVEGATEDNARENMRQFVKDVAAVEGLKPEAVSFGLPTDQGDGRWSFEVRVRRDALVDVHVVEMPGLPLRQVNFGAGEDDDIFDFPRLYVDGSSWVWSIAVGMFEREGGAS